MLFSICLLLSIWRNLISSQVVTSYRPQPNFSVPFSTINTCCELASALDIIECVNASSNLNVLRLDSELYQLYHSKSGPSVNVGIVTYATNDIWDYTAYSYGINEIYAEVNNYRMVLLDPSSYALNEFDSRWNKIKILIDAMDDFSKWGSHLDYIMWVDADLVFLDMGLRIELVASQHPNAHIIISAGMKIKAISNVTSTYFFCLL